MDEAFEITGGFGRFQKVASVINILTMGSAAFFLYQIVFLEMAPKYECFNSKLQKWESCEADAFCPPESNVHWRVDWNDSESLHNLIVQLGYYCVSSSMIGLFGAFFLFWRKLLTLSPFELLIFRGHFNVIVRSW